MAEKEPGPGVFISLKDVYEQLVALNNEIRGLVSRVDNTRDELEEHERELKDLEIRVRGLEQWKHAIPATVLVTLVMLVVEVMKLVVK